jgi:hypothetical protein
MTAFTPSDIPTEIDTVEKLHVWTSTLLSYLYPDLTVIESAGSAVRAMTSGPFQITAVEPSIWRLVDRGSIALDKEWRGANNQVWNYALPLGTTAIPASFKS